MGVSKVQATGKVYHLGKVADFEGTYAAAEGGATVGAGAGVLTMRNQHGLPEGQVVSLQQRLLGSGRRVQFDVKQTVGGQGMEVYRLFFAFSALDHRQNEVYWT